MSHESQPSDHATGELSPPRRAGRALPEAAVAVWLEVSAHVICSVPCKRQMTWKCRVPCSNIIRIFKMAAAEQGTKCGLLSSGPDHCAGGSQPDCKAGREI